MNDTNRKNLSKKMKETLKKIEIEPGYALKLLIRTGICTPTGRLKKRFK